MGSITGVPNYPSISGYTQNDINSQVSSAEADYQSKFQAYSSIRSTTESSLTQVNIAISNYQATGYTLASADTYLANALNTRDQVYANPNSTAQQKSDADAAVTAAYGVYGNVLAKYIALRDAINTYNTHRTQAATALSNLQTAAVTLANAYARRQLYTDSTSASTISSNITALEISTDGFQGLTQAQYNQLINSLNTNTDARTNLINAFNAYRYLEWQISDKRVQLVTAIDEERYRYALYLQNPEQSSLANDYNTSYNARVNINTDALNLINQRSTVSAALDTAISAYNASYMNIRDPILTAISSARDQAVGWSDYLEQLRTNANTNINTMYNQHVLQDDAARNLHYQTYPNSNQSVIDLAVSEVQQSYKANIAKLTSSGPGIGTLNAAGIPVLPAGNRPLSLSDLMRLLSQVQLMMDELARTMAEADSSINSYRRELAGNDMEQYVKLRYAVDRWATQLYGADRIYNEKAMLDNLQNYNSARNVFITYSERMDVINGVIDQINAEIDEQNARARALVDAANAIGQEAVKAVNATNKNKAETANTLDHFYYDTDITAPGPVSNPSQISYPPTIPHFSHIGGFQQYPSPATSTDPNTFPNSSDLAAFNNDIVALANLIAPFKERVQKALMVDLNGSENGYQVLELEKIYYRNTIDLRGDTLKSEFEGFFTFIFSFSAQLLAMRNSLAFSKEQEEEFVANATKRILNILNSPITVERGTTQDTSETIGVGAGLSIASINAKPSKIAAIINQIAQTSAFASNISRVFERASLLAGIQTAGLTPDAVKSLSTLGIPITELLLEKGISLNQVVQAQSDSSLTFALIEQLSGSVKNSDGLLQNAIEIASQIPEIKGMSEEELQELLNGLIALQQMILLLIAAFLGVSFGIPASEVLSGFGEKPFINQELKNLFASLGISEEKAVALTQQLDGSLAPLEQLFQNFGMSPEAKTALFLLIAANRGNISLTQDLPGGEAFFNALLQTLVREGVLPPTSVAPFISIPSASLPGINTPLTSSGTQEAPADGATGINSSIGDKPAATTKQSPSDTTGASEKTPDRGEKTGVLKEVKTAEGVPSNELLQQIGVQLEIKATTLQGEVIKREILRYEIDRADRRSEERQRIKDEQRSSIDNKQQSPLEQLQKQFDTIFNNSWNTLQDISRNPFTGLLPESVERYLGIDRASDRPLPPNKIVDALRDDFRRLPQETQQTFIEKSREKLKNVPDVKEEDKAILLFALVSGKSNPKETALLLELMISDQRAQAGLSLSSTPNEIIQRLFRPTEEDIRVKEELQSKRSVIEDFDRKINRPATLPKQTREIMREALEIVTNNYVDNKYAAKTLESFVRMVSKMTDFNEIAVDFLMDPAKSILKEFSIITRSSSDKIYQPPVLLGG